jgi:hypothetical protein
MKFLNTLALTCIATSAIADTTLTYTSKKDKEVMKMQFSGNMMRATSVDDNSSFMIYDGNNKTFTMFANDEKKYYVLDEEDIAKLSDMSAMIESMMEKQLANVPEAQKEMMRNMMANAIKAQMPKELPKAVYSLTGKSSSYNGFDCQVVSKTSGKKKSEFCVTDYSNLGMSSNEYAIITSFQNTIAALAQKYGADNSMDFSSLGQFMPVKFSQEGESGTLTDVNHDTLDASLFAVPEGYSEMEMPF